MWCDSLLRQNPDLESEREKCPHFKWNVTKGERKKKKRLYGLMVWQNRPSYTYARPCGLNGFSKVILNCWNLKKFLELQIMNRKSFWTKQQSVSEANHWRVKSTVIERRKHQLGRMADFPPLVTFLFLVLKTLYFLSP